MLFNKDLIEICEFIKEKNNGNPVEVQDIHYILIGLRVFNKIKLKTEEFYQLMNIIDGVENGALAKNMPALLHEYRDAILKDFSEEYDPNLSSKENVDIFINK